jgi:phosphoheptose isomerase
MSDEAELYVNLYARMARTAEVLSDSGDLAASCARWGSLLAVKLSSGQRLLTAGNGGSAAQAQHLTAELVGRFRSERRPLSAIPLHADTSSLTAIGNDYGATEVYARQVEAHGRVGDVLVLLSTSGRSPNLLEAARRARRVGVEVWALTGPAPNPLTELADEYIAVDCTDTAVIQEVHLVAAHLICEAIDATLAPLAERSAATHNGRRRTKQRSVLAHDAGR